MTEIRRIVKGGNKKIQECQDEIDKTLEAAEKTHSPTRVVDACKGALQIHLASLQFTIQISGHEMAKALNKDIFQLEDTAKQHQTAIQRKAEQLMAIALSVSTSDEQVGPISTIIVAMRAFIVQKSEIEGIKAEFEKVKNMLTELTTEQKLKLLMGVIINDPHIQTREARGHIYRCPNGHYYIIGECGGANQGGVCPDCGARIGGGGLTLGHTLAPANARITIEEANLMNR